MYSLDNFEIDVEHTTIIKLCYIFVVYSFPIVHSFFISSSFTYSI